MISLQEATASTADEGADGDSGGEEHTSYQGTTAQRQVSLGSWTEAEKKELVKMVSFFSRDFFVFFVFTIDD